MELHLKFYYIDAENVGLNLLKEQPVSALDRFYIFTNSEGIKEASANPLLNVVSGYPAGSNQADFYIIAHLSLVLSHISKADKKKVQFILCSKDVSLWKAFDFQCSLAGATAISTHIETEANPKPVQTAIQHPDPVAKIVKPCAIAASKGVELSTDTRSEILKLMVRPATAANLRSRIKVSQAAFQRSFNQLISEGAVKRQNGSRLNWVRA